MEDNDPASAEWLRTMGRRSATHQIGPERRACRLAAAADDTLTLDTGFDIDREMAFRRTSGKRGGFFQSASRDMARLSQASAVFWSRLIVAGEMFRIDAISSTVRPPK